MQWSIILHRLKHQERLKQLSLLLVLLQSMLIFQVVPVHADSQESWDNACIHTTMIYGEPYKTVCYSMPQVVDVGEGFVEYNIERVKANEFWIDCPTSSFYIKTAKTEVWSVNRTEQRLSKCIWQLWAFNDSWIEIEDSDSTFTIKEHDTSASLEYYRLMEDTSTFNVTWTFENRAKASVIFTAGQARPYAITWHVECPKATEETLEGERLTLVDESKWLCLLDYYDARMFHNQTAISALGATGRKARVTFANKSFTSGETLLIDPIVDTFEGMSNFEGYLHKLGSEYPPTTTTAHIYDTSFVGQKDGYGLYEQWRTFLSFNTTGLNETLTVERVELNIWAEAILGVEYNVKVYSGTYGYADEYDPPPPPTESPLKINDWDNCTNYQGILLNSATASGKKYHTLIMATDGCLNKSTGLTQFRLTSSREEDDEVPTGREYVWFYLTQGTNDAYLEVYYEQEEDQETKGEGTEGTGTGGGQSFEDIVEGTAEAIRIELSQRGLLWIGGSLVLVVVAGVYAGSKTKKVSRKAKGKTGEGGSRQPRGTPKKRSRDARGRFQ